MKKFFEEFKEFASSFLSDVVNFIFMAFVLFCLLKAINKLTSIGHTHEEEVCKLHYPLHRVPIFFLQQHSC